MKNKNMMLIAMLAFSSLTAFAEQGGNVGNGGIAMVCRDTPIPPNALGKITEAKLLDLWAPNIIQVNNSITDWFTQLQKAYEQTEHINSGATNLLKKTVLALIREEVKVPMSKLGAMGLELPNDFLPAIKLRPNCQWEALGRFQFIPELGKNGLLVNQEIYDYLEKNAPTNIAAFYYHEGLYQLYRSTSIQNMMKDPLAPLEYDSRVVQGLTALAFSREDYSDTMRLWFVRSIINVNTIIGIRLPQTGTSVEGTIHTQGIEKSCDSFENSKIVVRHIENFLEDDFFVNSSTESKITCSYTNHFNVFLNLNINRSKYSNISRLHFDLSDFNSYWPVSVGLTFLPTDASIYELTSGYQFKSSQILEVTNATNIAAFAFLHSP